MIRTLIIDDEANNRRKIRELLENHFPNVQIVGEADGVKTGLEAIINNTPELVLLDIRYPLLTYSQIESALEQYRRSKKKAVASISQPVDHRFR